MLQYSSVELVETLRAACLRTLDGLTTLLTTPPPNTQRPPLIADAATLLQAIFILMVRSCMQLHGIAYPGPRALWQSTVWIGWVLAARLELGRAGAFPR